MHGHVGLSWDDGLDAVVAEAIEAIVGRTVNDQPSCGTRYLKSELLVCCDAELAGMGALLDDPVFFAPFVCYFDPVIVRPSIPMGTYLRMMS